MASPAALRSSLPALAVALVSLLPASALAGDKTWDNGSSNFIWDTSSVNWTGSTWVNANGDGAIFNGAGFGAISLPGAIDVNSLNITTNGYTFNGAGSLNFVNGTSTQTTGVINVAAGVTTTMNVGLSSSQTAIQKIGAGVLELSQPLNLGATFALVSNNALNANLLIGPAPVGTSPPGGTVRVLNSGVLSSSIKVGMGAGGTLDIGSNNVTIGELIFTNQSGSAGYSYPNIGVTGSGTLRVMGDINVIGQGSNYGFNAISSNLDLGGGSQVIRSAAVTFFAGPSNLMLTGVLSNGSLIKTLGLRDTGILGGQDGIALMGNNTYTGATVINGGTIGSSMASGTNASTSLKVVSAVMSIQGANGSYLSANAVDVFAGSTLILDNNATFGGSNGVPLVAAANNNDRLSDSATITLRDSNLTLRGFAGAATSETVGALNVAGGHNVITVTPNGGGTATLSAGNLSLDPRATLQIASGSATQTLSTTGQLKFAGGIPAAIGGIIPRIIATSNTATDGGFVTYDATNGFTPLAAGSYASSYTAGANVSVGSAQTVSSSVAINAVKTTASMTTTINAGQVLSVNSGMMLAASGTHTLTGGTLDFGATPGVFFGSHTVNSAVTGSQGLLNTTGTLTLNGDLSGLTGTLSNIGTGTLTLATNTFTGAIENRRGTLNINTSLGAGGAITLGVAANDANLYAAPPSLSISGAGANAIINRDIIVDNGATNAAGLSIVRQGFIVGLSPLSNSSGSQTLNGNILLNTSLNVQGGGGSGTGATIFGGNISGAGTLVLANGRANFTGDISNAGGLLISSGGFTGIANFQGTVSGNVPIVINGGSSSTTGISYSTQANIGTGLITVNAAGNPLPTVRILGTSSISNAVFFPAFGNTTFIGGVNVDVAPSVTGTWNGAVTGIGAINKLNTGTLVLTNPGNTYTGNTTVSAGTLQLTGNGSFANSPNIIVGAATGSTAVLDVAGVSGGANFDAGHLGGAFATAAGQTLKGFGTVSGKTVISNGSTIAPGGSIGILSMNGDVYLAGNYAVEAVASGGLLADQIKVTSGNLTIDPTASLTFMNANTYNGLDTLTLIDVTGGGTLSGLFNFSQIFNMPAGYVLAYTGSSLYLTPVPEPSAFVLAGLAAVGLVIQRRRRKTIAA